MVLPHNDQNLPQVALVEDVQLLAYSCCALPGLTGVYGCRDDEGGIEIKPKRAGSPHVVKSSKDCCCFCQPSVDIIFNVSISRYYTFQIGGSFDIFCSLVQRLLAAVMGAG